MSAPLPDPAAGATLGATVRRLLHGAAELGRTRLELALLELEAERARLAGLLLRAALALFLACLATVLAIGAWLLSVPAGDRPAWTAALSLACAAAALALAVDARRLWPGGGARSCPRAGFRPRAEPPVWNPRAGPARRPPGNPWARGPRTPGCITIA